ncbi:MAG: heme-binding protein [Erysipelotrichaceae bacterium]|nr:heme-binding protein [Erysipelotrichaceae bacterium]
MSESVLKLEEELSFESFNHEDAYRVGALVIDRVKRDNLKPVRIRVVLKGDIVFQYLMDGKAGDMWLNRKQKTVEAFGHSSYYIACVNKETQEYESYRTDDTMVICGGGFPIIVNHEIVGSMMVSGLADHEDHQLIVDALRELKEKKHEG